MDSVDEKWCESERCEDDLEGIEEGLWWVDGIMINKTIRTQSKQTKTKFSHTKQKNQETAQREKLPLGELLGVKV